MGIEKDCEISILKQERSKIKEIVRTEIAEIRDIKNALSNLTFNSSSSNEVDLKQVIGKKDKTIEKLRREVRSKLSLVKEIQVKLLTLEKSSKKSNMQLRENTEDLQDENRKLMRLQNDLRLDLDEKILDQENYKKRELYTERKYRKIKEENIELSNKLLENEEDLEAIMEKYKAAVDLVSKYQLTIEEMDML